MWDENLAAAFYKGRTEWYECECKEYDGGQSVSADIGICFSGLFNMALTTFIGQNLGAKKYDRAKTGSRFGVLSSVILAELIGIGMYLFAAPLLRMFSDDPGVVEIGVRQMHIEALFYCLLAFSHAIAAVCRGAGKAVVPMVIMLAVWCVLRITYITIAMQTVHELAYIYWAYPLTWGISSVIFLIYYKCSDWIHGFDVTVQPCGK